MKLGHLKYLVLFILSICYSASSFAQLDSVYSYYDVEFKTKTSSIGYEKFLDSALVLPESAKRHYINESVYVSFVVNVDSSISNIELEKGIGYDCDEEALRVTKLITKWNIGYKDGIPVPYKLILPIKFDYRSIPVIEKGIKNGNKYSYLFISGQIKSPEGKSLYDGLALLYLGDSLVSKSIQKHGGFGLDLHINNYYEVVFTKEGYYSKSILVDTHCPSRDAKYGFEFGGWQIELTHIGENDEYDENIFKKISLIKYDDKFGGFNYYPLE
jgi:hypothetical protein